ncbi:MAG: VCBS repeat-containing protein, partial [Verrucomicrobiales bacterium]
SLESDAQPFSGLADCEKSLGELVATLGQPDHRRVSLKISGVSLNGQNPETTVTYDAAGRGPTGMVQQSAQWSCTWQIEEEDGHPRLLSIRSNLLEEVETKSDAWFSDVTVAVLGNNSSFKDQVAFGLNHWLERIDHAYGLNYFRRHGVAVGDANGDGLDDIYLCQPGGLPNRLYLRQEGGTATDASAAFGVDWLDNTASALFVDLDNDGDQDLAMTMRSGVQVLENVDNKTFQLRATLPLLDNDTLSLSAVDYDSDGDLDFFVCVGFADKNAHAKQGRHLPGFVFHDARDGGQNALFRNDRGWQFSDVTTEAGLGSNNVRHSLAASWEDYDKDGDPDLYIANDYGPNCLFRNEGGRFEEIAAASGVLDFGAGMSVSWGDYNRDGWMDLYVANMFSYAGNRIANQPEFLQGHEKNLRDVNRRFAKGNSLFKNSPSGLFTETGGSAGVERGRWAWGSIFADINNDGWEDLFVSNGYITTEDTGDL